MRQQDEKKQLRHFGLLVGGLFAVVGLWPALFRAEGPRLWALALTLVLVVPALALPRSLTYVYRIWMAARHINRLLGSRPSVRKITPSDYASRTNTRSDANGRHSWWNRGASPMPDFA